MQLTLDIPDYFFNFNNTNEVENEIKLNYALVLFMQGKISVSMAAELSGLNLYDFIYYCRQNKIPVYNITPEDLDNELKEFNS